MGLAVRTGAGTNAKPRYRTVVVRKTDHLRAVGYQQRPVGEENGTGSFEVDGNEMLISPGDAASSQLSFYPVRIQEDRSGRVVSLTNPMTGERLSSAAIEGELLATVR